MARKKTAKAQARRGRANASRAATGKSGKAGTAKAGKTAKARKTAAGKGTKPAAQGAKRSRAAGGQGTSAPRRRASGGGGRRIDLVATNDSHAMLLAAPEALGRGLDTGTPGWNAEVRRGRLWCVDLGMDATIAMRVLVGGALSPEEEAAWVGRLEHRLDLPSGRLVVVGGIELSLEPGAAEDLDGARGVRVLDLPAGTYRATLHAYVTSPLGEELLGRGGERGPVGAWWRATRPGEPMPEWVAERCRDDPAAADPGHEAEWVNVRGPRRPAPTVEWLLHLRPLAGAGPACPALDGEGWFGAEAFEAREVEVCPGSLALDPEAQGAEPRGEEDDQPWETDLPAPVYPRVARLPLAELDPVELPLEHLARAIRITWFPCDAAEPELRLEPAGGQALPAWAPVEGVHAFPEGEGWRLAFQRPGGGNPFAWELGSRGWPEGAARALAGLGVDGATLEVCAAPGRCAREGLGVLRLRGRVQGRTWRITAAHPPVSAERLRAALALSAEVDRGQELRLERGERALLAAWEEEDGVVLLADGNSLQLTERKARLEEARPDQLGILARVLFRSRFADVWPCEAADGDGDAPSGAAAGAGGSNRPDAGELLFQGSQARYHALRGRPPEVYPALEPLLDQAYGPEGYLPLGNFASSVNDEVVIRVYAPQSGTALALVILNGVGDGFHQALSRFADGAWLSTWSLGEGTAADAPEQKLFRQAVEPPSRRGLAKGVTALLAAHAARSAALEGDHGPALPAARTLTQAAEALDGYRARLG